MMMERKSNSERRIPALMRIRLLLLTATILFFGSTVLMHGDPTNAFEPGAENEATVNEPSFQDFSRFRHDTQQHRRMPCLVCHVRSDNRATPSMPGHIPCSSCHAQQFAEGNKSPICYICHTETSVKRFPSIRSFNILFDHGRHVRQTGCATCHKPIRAGVALSIPSGFSAHMTCFQCHGPRNEIGGRNIGSCGVCHQPGRPVRTPTTAAAFKVNFSHAEHRAKGLACAECHTVRAGTSRGRQVSSPTAAMHLVSAQVRSCASCHNNQRAFGGNDFADCKRCHEGRTFRF